MDAVAGPVHETDIAKLKSEIVRLRRLLREAQAEVARLEPLVDLDPLVPLFNRRAFTRELDRVVSYCARYKTSAVLVYIDLDDFKSINDRFGHAAGDVVLKHVAHLLLQTTRKSDVIGRLGGDEFAVLLVRTDLAGGRTAAERTEKAIAEAAFDFGGEKIYVTASTGQALVDGSADAERIIHCADAVMYGSQD
ncbi:MAG: GGDEF domain-containing protein [Aestuariivirgaceae bacterium]